jgi:hypothetical protein
MSGDPLLKLRATPMAEVLPRLGLTGEPATLIQYEPDAAVALARLEEAGFVNEAAKLMAHALPRREAVWWACMCARHTAPPELPAADHAAVEAAEQWVRQQTDEARREAFDHAQQAGFGTPEAWAAVAAFWCGDSMSPLGQPKTPPAPHLAGTAVSGCVVLAAVRRFPERREDRLRRFLGSGRDIAAGGAGRLAAETA